MFIALFFCTAYTSVYADDLTAMLAGIMGGQSIDPAMVQSALADQSVLTKGQEVLAGMGGDIQQQASELKAAYEGGASLDILAKKTFESQSLDQMSEIAAKVQEQAGKIGITVPESMKDVDMAKLKSKAEEDLAKGPPTIPANIVEAAKKALNVKPATKAPAKKKNKGKKPKATTPKKKSG